MHGRSFSRRAAAAFGLAFIGVMAPSLAVDVTPWVVVGIPSGGIVWRVLMDPTDAQTLYALAPEKGVYKSTDGGGSWTLVKDDGTLGDLALDPQHPNTLYVSADNNAVFKSTDGGDNWTEMDTGLPAGQPATPNVVVDNVPRDLLAVDPLNSGTVYLVTNRAAVYKTTDGGQSWNESDSGIGPGSATNLQQAGIGVTSFSIDPVNPQVLFLTNFSSRDVVTGLPGMALAGVYRSTDGGASWSQVLSGEVVWTAAVQPVNDQVVFASGNYNFYISTDGGDHWTPYNAPNSPLNGTSFLWDPANTQHVWAGTQYQLFYSADGGATWGEPTTDFFNYASSDLVLDPATLTLYAASPAGYGVGKSTDGGATWGPANQGIDDVAVSQILVAHDGTLFLGTNVSGFFRSRDSGQTWTPVDGGIYSGSQTAVVQMVEDPSTSGIYGITGNIFHTTDQGDSWTRLIIPGGGFSSVALTPGHPSTVYATQMLGVEKSTDDGATWNLVNTGLPVSGDTMSAVASDPVNAGVVFAGTYNHGVYGSTDGGAHWSHVDGLTGTTVEGLAIDPQHPATLYATVDGHGVEKSTDGGASWTASTEGLGQDLLGKLYIDPSDGDVLVALSVISKNVYASTDAGVTWTLVSGATSDAVQATSGGTSAAKLPELTAFAMDPRHKGMAFGADTTGQVYSIDVVKLVADIKAAQSGSSGSSSSSGGGGDFSLLAGLAMLGIGFLRRRSV